jgi:MFS family permease
MHAMNLTRTVPDARRHDLAFWSVAFAFLAVMAFSTVPSPLYGLYQQRDGFSAFVITLIYAAYAVGVVSSLILAGHISDWHGRRRVLLPAIAITIVSALVFLVWRDLPGLIVARIINGFSVGVVTATATAYLADLHTAAHPGTGNRRSQVVATVVNVGGLGLGPLIAGFLAQWVGSPLTVPYAVFVVALLLAFVLVAVAPDPHTTPSPRPPYRIQRLAVPAEARGAFFAAAVGAFVAFGVLGLFTGLASTFLIGTLHQPSHALAGFTVFAMFAAGVVVQIATLNWAVRRVLSLGIALMLLGLALTVLAVWLPTPSLALLLLGGAVSGAGGGAVFKGAVGTVIEISPADTRAEALAGLFLAGYLGLSFPALGAGIALQYVSPRDTLLGFAVIVGVGIVATASRLLGNEAPPAALATN